MKLIKPKAAFCILAATLFFSCGGNEQNKDVQEAPGSDTMHTFADTLHNSPEDTTTILAPDFKIPDSDSSAQQALELKKKLAADSTGKLPEKTKKEMKKASEYIRNKRLSG